MARIAGWVGDVLSSPDDEARISAVRSAVRELCQAFPLYAELVSAS